MLDRSAKRMSVWVTVRAALAAFLTRARPETIRFWFAGGTGFALVLLWLHSQFEYVAVLGTVADVEAGLLLGAWLGSLYGWRARSAASRRGWEMPYALGGLLMLACSAPTLSRGLNIVLSQSGILRESMAWWNSVVLALLATGLSALVTALLARVCGEWHREGSHAGRFGLWSGLAAGLLAVPALCQTASGFHAAVVLCVAWLMTLGLYRARLARGGYSPATSAAEPVLSDAAPVHIAVGLPWFVQGLACVALGLAWTAFTRLGQEMVMVSALAVWGEMLLAGVGLLVGTGLLSRRHDSSRAASSSGKPTASQNRFAMWGELLPLLCAIAWLVWLCAFPWRLEWVLWSSAYITVPSVSLSVRFLVAFAPLAGCGALAAWSLPQLGLFSHTAADTDTDSSPTASSSGVVRSLVGGASAWRTLAPLAVVFATALLCGRWVLPVCGPTAIAIAASALCALVGVAAAVVRRQANDGAASPSPLGTTRLSTWRGVVNHVGYATLGCATVVLVFIGVSLRAARFDSAAVCARTLFSTQAFLCYRQGVETSLLRHLDEGRPYATLFGSHGTWTVWDFGGMQRQVRHDGLPQGGATLRREVFPQSVTELLQTVAPCAMHPSARKVLLLGLGSGQAATNLLRMPLLEIDCVEGDRHLAALMARDLRAEDGTLLLADDRVKLRVEEPSRYLAATRVHYDVIVHNTSHAATWQSLEQFSSTFYRRAAWRLADNGIFCQRLLAHDFGPEPLQMVVSRMRSVFPHVVLLEATPGEFVLLGGRTAIDMEGNEMLRRWQAPHMRQLLSEAGLDWSVPLNLPAWLGDGLDTYCAEVEDSWWGPATTLRWAFRAPVEVSRWGTKMTERFVAGKATASRLADHLTNVGEYGSPELLRRLSEVRGQHDLMAKHSEQYWAYRASLRDQLVSNNASKIRRVSVDETQNLASTDRRRYKYFESLGVAVKTRSAEDISALMEFARPYDPLMSFFVRQEAAELWKQSNERRPHAELENRLYAVYYASTGDKSTRNSIEALELLQSHPELIADRRERYDLMNSLIQTLKYRWDARAGVAVAKPSQTVRDIDQTLVAIERALDTLESLADELRQPEQETLSRRRAVEKSLITPLRLYRQSLDPHRKQETLRESQDEGT